MPLSNADVTRQWYDLPKNWHSLYKWERTTGAAYLDLISALIQASIADIHLDVNGLRKDNFHLPEEHKGLAEIQENITQFKEKRFCRAMFNHGRTESTLGNLEPFGEFLDYEVPLLAPGAGIQAAAHGRIDLVSRSGDMLFLIEAKGITSDSVLKAILEAFTYSLLVAKRRVPFCKSFGVDEKIPITPAVLVLECTKASEQLDQLHKGGQLDVLIKCLNQILAKNEIGKMRFYVAEGDKAAIRESLEAETINDKFVRIRFKQGCTPTIREIE